jgi:hypothetical protein
MAALPDQASPDDPNEISFVKGEILDILDKSGKWWQARKSDGAVGSKYPFNSKNPLLTTRFSFPFDSCAL